MTYRLRKATLADQSALTALIARSARALSVGDYRPEQRVTHELAPGITIDFVPMRKELTLRGAV